MTLPLVIDTDPGIDDSLALILAARARGARLLAVSASYGNTTLDNASRNARLVLGRAGAAVPVFSGADRPLVRPLATAKETHGTDGLGDHRLPPAAPVRPTSTGILDALRAAGGPVTLVTLGPLTNLALALRNDPAFLRSRVTRHVAMGGNIAAAGNSGGLAEFNVWCDPEAAAEVFAARLGTELVGLDVTRRLVIPAAAVHKLASHRDGDAQWLGALLGFYVRFHQEREGLPGAVINDPLAVALALEPSWGSADSLPIAVSLAEATGRGETRVGGAGEAPVRVYRDVIVGPVHDLLLEYLFGRWLTKADFQP
ncbi:MAG: nucleoside hydrolase [Gemmatimonadales bacterium]